MSVRLLLAGGLLLLAGPAPAQEPVPPPADPPPVLVRARVVNAWPDNQFDQWALGEARTVDGAWRRLETLLALHVDDIDRACKLTADQKKKLRLLGWGDCKRVLDDYEAAKKRFNDLGNDVQRINELWPLVAPVQEAVRAGPFRTGSMLHKAVRHTLTAEQLAAYDAAQAERRATRHKALVELAVASFEESVPLTAAQRPVLLAALLRHTTPPRAGGMNDFYLIMGQAGKVPEAAVRPPLTPAQWAAWSGFVAQYKGMADNARRNGRAAADDAPADKD